MISGATVGECGVALVVAIDYNFQFRAMRFFFIIPSSCQNDFFTSRVTASFFACRLFFFKRCVPYCQTQIQFVTMAIE